MSQSTFNLNENGTVRETVSDGEHLGVPYTIIRTNEPHYTNGFEYEFLLFIDKQLVTTATNLETNGTEHPWIPALESYAQAYIDGKAGYQPINDLTYPS